LGSGGSDPSDEVYAVDATTGGGLTKLTDCPGVDTFCINDYPVWSPDGQRIRFTHGEQFDADGNPLDEQVWVMDANGSHKQQLTFDNRVKDQVPDWSPDGSKIAYQSGGFGDGQIWVMNANGSGQHQLTGCGPSDPSPCASGGGASNRRAALACLILGATDRAEDAPQAALVRAWREIPRLRDAERFDAWLRRLVVNACYDEARRVHRRAEVSLAVIGERSVVDTASASAEADLLVRAFRRLPLGQRVVLAPQPFLSLIHVA